jgi:hypothetical protein
LHRRAAQQCAGIPFLPKGVRLCRGTQSLYEKKPPPSENKVYTVKSDLSVFARLGCAAILMLVASALVAADTYSLVDEKYLPLRNINDPVSHVNRPIVRYSFEQLDMFLWESPSFLRWNDGRKVCESMQLMFGRASGRCALLPPPKTYEPPVRHTYVAPPGVPIAPRRTSAQARVTFTIMQFPPPRMLPPPNAMWEPVVVVAPMYAPYAPYPWA